MIVMLGLQLQLQRQPETVIDIDGMFRLRRRLILSLSSLCLVLGLTSRLYCRLCTLLCVMVNA